MAKANTVLAFMAMVALIGAADVAVKSNAAIASSGRFSLALDGNSLVGVPIDGTKVLALPKDCSVLHLFFAANSSAEGRGVA
ncbi:hypothetical protein SUGI_0685000 [Cryptomeria japonica]|nr:hypothetical protein SUGI_0685000 [Cryptomeria japonica]